MVNYITNSNSAHLVAKNTEKMVKINKIRQHYQYHKYHETPKETTIINKVKYLTERREKLEIKLSVLNYYKSNYELQRIARNINY